MQFVKPGAVIRDTRAEDVKDQELEEATSRNLFHVQKQLKASGHSIEEVIAVAAKNHFGVAVQPHAPVPKKDVAQAEPKAA